MSQDAARAPTIIERLFRPVDIASLAAFRLIFGGCMLFENSRYLYEGYLKSYLIDPAFHFKFYGFSWIGELPEPLMYTVFWVMIIASLLVCIGAYYRLAAVTLFVTFSYTFLLEAAAYRNHFYLLALLSFLMIFLPAHRAWSVDARRRPELASEVVPQWSVWLLQFQLGVVYFFAGVAKLDPDWISGSSIHAIIDNGGHSAEEVAFLKQGWVTFLFTWSGLLFDLFIVFALLWSRTRLFAFLAAAGFHLTNALYLVDVGIFPWFMLLGSSIYFRPNWPRALWHRLDATVAAALPAAAFTSESRPLDTKRKLIAGLLALHIVVQIFLPLRQHLYPGPTSWTHEGHRWAWRMKLVSKSVTSIRLFSYDPVEKQTIDLSGNFFILTGWQKERMGRQPDLLLQFAHDVHEQLLVKTGKDLPIYADVHVTMNGRASQPLIDPTVDLAREKWTIGPARWILPMQETNY